MQHFDIAKYLKENHLGSHAILGKYVDLHGLKEAKELYYIDLDSANFNNKIFQADLRANGIKTKIVDPAGPAGYAPVVRYIANSKQTLADMITRHWATDPETASEYFNDIHTMNEDKDLGQQDTMPEPYEGPEDPIDGLGGELDRHMDVSMNEVDGEENNWMKDVDGTKAYEVGKWKCYYGHPGMLVWSYDDKPFSEIAIYATPNYDGDDTTPIQIVVGEENEDMMSLNQGIFTDFNEYAKAMKPYLDRIENLESNWGSLAELENINEVSAFEEKRQYYEGEVNDIVYDMMDTTGADKDEVADFFQYISTKIRNEGIF